MSKSAHGQIAPNAPTPATERLSPGPGAIGGADADESFGPASLNRGGVHLNAPFSLPTDRGEALVNFWPSYSTEHGLSEWGKGWDTSLAITRWSLTSYAKYDGEYRFNSPWGVLSKGDDGYWYPLGMQTAARVEKTTSGWTAYLGDGSIWSFGDGAKIDAPQGTYAWMLSKVSNPVGAETRITYDVNASGRYFVKDVTYGGRAADPQYRVELQYQTTPATHSDYRSGKALTLDRRVSFVVVSAKDPQTHEWQMRWRYALSYVDEGAAFYLKRVLQSFPDAETAPPITYDYYFFDSLSPPVARDVDAKRLQPLLATSAHPNIFLRGVYFDFNRDGYVDIEDPFDYSIYQQSAEGFVKIPSVPAAGAAPQCRPAFRQSSDFVPRTFAFMNDDPVVLYYDGSTVDLCSPEGMVLRYANIGNEWGNAHAAIYDVDEDGLTDLIRFSAAGYEILRQTSPGRSAMFEPLASYPLSGERPGRPWLQDINGDGVADLLSIGRNNQMTAWYGHGGGLFEVNGVVFPLRLADGGGYYLQYAPAFSDINHDGLTDLVAVTADSYAVFINDGTGFNEVPGMRREQLSSASAYAFSDLVGSGNPENFFGDAGTGAYKSVGFDTPGLGLLRSVDNGKGNIRRFTYKRGPGGVGVTQRQPVLATMTIESAGLDDSVQRYDYLAPTMSLYNKFLGYQLVTRHQALGDETAGFTYSLEGAALITLGSKETQSGLARYRNFEYQINEFHGVSWMRPTSQYEGIVDKAGHNTYGVVKTFVAYADELCPSTVTTQTDAGIITTDVEYAHLPLFAKHPTCLVATKTARGQDGENRYPSLSQLRFNHNDVGLVTDTILTAGGVTQTLSSIFYNADYTVDHVDKLDQGTTRFIYAPWTRLLDKVISPTGVVTEVVLRDLVADDVYTLRTNRGGEDYVQDFRYDGMGRLKKSWDNLSETSDYKPLTNLEYHFASSSSPGSIVSTGFVDVASNVALSSASFFDGEGGAIASASLGHQGWAFDALVRRTRANNGTEAYARNNSAKPNIAEITFAELYSDIVATTHTQHASYFGTLLDSTTEFETGVTGTAAQTLNIDGSIISEGFQNGVSTGKRTSSLDGRPIYFDDPDGGRFYYFTDAFGRLREVYHPDNTHVLISYDDLGRVTRLFRFGSALTYSVIDYLYDPAHPLRLSGKRYYGNDNSEQRTVQYRYDQLSRVVSVTYLNQVNGEQKVFNYYYDGSTPTAAGANDLGLLTAVSGDGYTKTFTHRADGKLLTSTLTLNGYRTLSDRFSYLSNGAVKEQVMTVADAAGQSLDEVSLATDVSGLPQFLRLNVNGWRLATLAHDGHLRIQDENIIGMSRKRLYDAHTGALIGTQGGNVLSMELHRNNRGFLASEALNWFQSSPVKSARKDYTYSKNGSLLSAGNTDGYRYDASGLQTWNNAVGSITRSGNAITAGAQYTFDHLGRVAQIGELQLSYGADGQISKAQRGASVWQYLYDENGQRLAKLQDGQIVTAYWGDRYIDGRGLRVPIRIGGMLSGYVYNGIFHRLNADIHGTVTADAGTYWMPSAYGARFPTDYTRDSAFLDYVDKGYDADLGLVRMGVRDYDPRLGQFMQPDPLYLETPELALAGTVSANLYSYARNNPVNFLDPSGMLEAQCGFASAVECGDGNGGGSGGIPDMGIGVKMDRPPSPASTADKLRDAIETTGRRDQSEADANHEPGSGGDEPQRDRGGGAQSSVVKTTSASVINVNNIPGVFLMRVALRHGAKAKEAYAAGNSWATAGYAAASVIYGAGAILQVAMVVGALRSVGEPAIAPEGGMTTLYRAVNPAELASIESSGGAFSNIRGFEGKYFSVTAEGATSYVKQVVGTGLYEGPYTIVETRFPTSMISSEMTAVVDRGISSVVVRSEDLGALSPARIWPVMPLP